jgi:hypothetical protein
MMKLPTNSEIAANTVRKIVKTLRPFLDVGGVLVRDLLTRQDLDLVVRRTVATTAPSAPRR